MQIIDNIKYFTRPEAAEEIGVPVSTLEYWAHKGRGPVYSKPTGKAAMYAESDIVGFKAAQIAATRRGGIS